MQREKLGSRLGFILLSAGCAIGIGNVWKFPYIVGQYGGGMFVLIYLCFLAVMGVPVLTMEFAIGRASQRSPARMYHPLTKNKAWYAHSYAALAGNYILMMFYTVVCGWMLYYFWATAKGSFVGLDAAGVKTFFADLKLNLGAELFCTALVVLLGFAVCSGSLQKGLERITKYMMLALLVLIVVLAVHSVCLDGGKEGLEFYLKPDLDRMKAAGIGSVISAAMQQAFFTLSLGIGSMAIFGSYLNKDRALMGEAVNVSVLDTFVAFTSALIIFPACSAYGVEVDAGPSLIFVTLPNVFNNLPGGRLWGSLFFVFMSFAALSTVFAVFENILACTMDLFGWSRKKACLYNCLLMLVLVLPCVLGFNLWNGFHPFGGNSTVMDLEDFLVSNILLPLGSLVFVLFCTCRYGWGWDKFVAEANTGKGLKVAGWMRKYMTYVLPVGMIVLFVASLISYFA